MCYFENNICSLMAMHDCFISMVAAYEYLQFSHVSNSHMLGNGPCRLGRNCIVELFGKEFYCRSRYPACECFRLETLVNWVGKGAFARIILGSWGQLLWSSLDESSTHHSYFEYSTHIGKNSFALAVASMRYGQEFGSMYRTSHAFLCALFGEFYGIMLSIVGPIATNLY